MTSASSASYIKRPTSLRRRQPFRRVEAFFDTSAVGTDLNNRELPVFPGHSEEEFIHLAETEPARLIELLETELRQMPALLTFAAEAAGRITDSSLVVGSLTALLSHEDAVVREGAVYGLMPHLEASIAARDALRELAKGEPSPGVRLVVGNALALVE